MTETRPPDKNLVTSDLLAWLEADALAPIGEYLYPLVHTAVRQYSARKGLTADEIDDLDGEAFLYVFQQIRQRYTKSSLSYLGAALIYLMIRDCYVAQQRRHRSQIQADVLDISLADTDLRLTDSTTEDIYRAAETRDLWEDATGGLDPQDSQTLDLLQTHYRLCEDQADPSLDPNDSTTIKKLHAQALKHMAVSLGMNLSTAYRRTARLREHMLELIETRLDVKETD